MKYHYCSLGRYIEELNRSNKGSTFILQIKTQIGKEIPILKGLLFALKALRRGGW